jgi:hypothetical protein
VIEVNTVVFEQLKKIIEIQQNILEKSDQSAEKQKSIIDGLNQLISSLGTMNGTFKDISVQLKKHMDDFSGETNKFSERFQRQEIEAVKSDSRLVNKIHIAWGLMGGIVISLIGLITTIVQKDNMIGKVAEICIQIAKKLGVSLQ